MYEMMSCYQNACIQLSVSSMSNSAPTLTNNPLPGVPIIESPFFHSLLKSSGFDDETRRVATDLHTKGYAVIDFPEPDFDVLAESIKANLHGHYNFDYWKGLAHTGGFSLRVQDAWEFDDNVKRIACNEHLLALLSRVYGRAAWPFQTLNFPVGTQQHFHSDSMHFSSAPERFMCGVWVALEDITMENGPLVYYPGSHKWPIYTNEHMGRCVAESCEMPNQSAYEPMWRALVEANEAKPDVFLAKKGQALIWAANLMHGGMLHNDTEKTRWSQVTHYFFDDCSYYTPMTSDPFYGRIDFRELKSIATGQTVPHKYSGFAVPERFTRLVSTTGQQPDFDDLEFDCELYLRANPDVAAAGMNPAEHYLRYGIKEKRKMRP